MTVRAPKAYAHLAERLHKNGAMSRAYAASLTVNCLRLVGDFITDGLPHLASGDTDAFFDEMSTAARHRFNPLNGTFVRALDILQITEALSDHEMPIMRQKMGQTVVLDYERRYKAEVIPAITAFVGDGNRVCCRKTVAAVREILTHEPLRGEGPVQCRSCTIPSVRETDPPIHLSQLLSAGRELSLFAFQSHDEGAKTCLLVDGQKTQFAKDIWVVAAQREAAVRRAAAARPAPSYGAQAAMPA